MNKLLIQKLLLTLDKPISPTFTLDTDSYLDGDKQFIRSTISAKHPIQCSKEAFGDTSLTATLVHKSLADIVLNKELPQYGKMFAEWKSDCFESDYPIYIEITHTDGSQQLSNLNDLLDIYSPDNAQIKTLLETNIFPYQAISDQLYALDTANIINSLLG